MTRQTQAGELSPEALLPGDLFADGISLRSQTQEDAIFMRDLYVSYRWAEMQAISGWTDETRLAFLRDQARLQWRHYADAYKGSQFLIVEKDATPIGRIYVFHHHGAGVLIVDIGFMPEWRGHGYGTALLRSVQAFAASVGEKCSIHVERHNPARRLYRRLGFVEVSCAEPYFLMEWRAAPSLASTA